MFFKALMGNLDYFAPFSSSLISFIASRTGCFPSCIPSSWSSAAVNCLKGSLNLIACGIVNVTREALSLLNML